MEVYEGVREPAAFESALAELFAASGLAAFLETGSERKTERFVAAQS